MYQDFKIKTKIFSITVHRCGQEVIMNLFQK
jgi:hypothetical protein